MRWLIEVCALALALYTGFQSILISQIGFNNQIPQLEGDGGGGIIFAFLTFLAAIIYLIKPTLAIIIFLLSTIVSAFSSFLFGDSVILLWSAGTVILAFLCYLANRISRRRLLVQSGK